MGPTLHPGTAAGRTRWEVLFGVDARHPVARQVAQNLALLFVVIGGGALGTLAIGWFPILVEDGTVYSVGLSALGLVFAASFLVFKRSAFPRSLPLIGRVLARLGWSLGFCFLCLGVALIVNGYGTAIETRDVRCVGKRATFERDPARKHYYLFLRARPGSDAVVSVTVPRATYLQVPAPLVRVDTPQRTLDALPPGATVHLTVGQGRLGLEWFKGAEPG